MRSLFLAAVIGVAASAPPYVAANSDRPRTAGGAVTTRSTVDRPDDLTGAQVHVVYALPSDGADAQLDTNGTIAASVASAQTWLRGQNAGRGFRLDTSGGELDVTFFRSVQADAALQGYGAFVRDQLESEMRAAGLLATSKIYLVYYGGGSTWACGGGAWPPDLPGQVAALYLNGTPPGAIPCANNPFAATGGAPGYWEFSALHELMHTVGFVPKCAPNHVLSGHVGDDPRDLMYAGPQPWQPSILDFNGNDYVKAAAPGCASMADNAYFEGAPTTGPAPAPPFGSFDTPADGASGLTGAIAVTGWALDDTSVTKVDILRDAHPNDPAGAVVNGRVFVGTATFVSGARPDVASSYGSYPHSTRAGWGYLMLTRGVVWDGHGAFHLYAVATDSQGGTTTLGSRRISINNAAATKPFGNIDTPGQGETIGSTYVNFGWVLPSVAGATIPAANVSVAIDGVILPQSSECLTSRADITSGYPAFDTSQAIRCFTIDTTKYVNGVHTIGWVVTDSGGRAEGIGSRFFTIKNPELSSQTATPGDGLTISGAFDASAITDVVLTDTGGNDVLIRAADVSSTSVSLVVPPYIDRQSLQPASGTVRVSIAQGTRVQQAGSLTINALAPITTARGTETLVAIGGIRTRLQVALKQWAAIEKASNGRVDSTTLRTQLTAMDSKLAGLQDAVSSAVAGKPIPLGTTLQGLPLSMTNESIDMLDKVFASAARVASSASSASIVSMLTADQDAAVAALQQAKRDRNFALAAMGATAATLVLVFSAPAGAVSAAAGLVTLTIYVGMVGGASVAAGESLAASAVSERGTWTAQDLAPVMGFIKDAATTYLKDLLTGYAKNSALKSVLGKASGEDVAVVADALENAHTALSDPTTSPVQQMADNADTIARALPPPNPSATYSGAATIAGLTVNLTGCPFTESHSGTATLQPAGEVAQFRFTGTRVASSGPSCPGIQFSRPIDISTTLIRTASGAYGGRSGSYEIQANVFGSHAGGTLIFTVTQGGSGSAAGSFSMEGR